MSVNAYADDVFVREIHVSGTAENSYNAKEKAITEGKEKTFEDLIALFSLTGEQKFSKREIFRSGQGFEVHNEIITPSDYSADLKIFFREDLIKKILLEHGSDVDKVHSALILPMFNGTFLKGKNPMYKALEHFDNKIIIPFMDLEDIHFIRNKLFHKLAVKYNVDSVIIASAVYKIPSSLKVTITSEYLPEKQLEFTDENQNELFYNAANEIVAYLELYGVKKEVYSKLIAKIKFNSLEEYLSYKKYIENIVPKVLIKEISINYAMIELYYNGNFRVFRNFLLSKGIQLLKKDNNWELRR